MCTKNIDIPLIAQKIREHFSDISFAYIFGSSQGGVVKSGSDVDVAVYYTGSDVFARFAVEAQVENVVGNAIPIDVVVLQKADPVLAFEALKGKLLFVRDENMEEYTNFYTRTCRLYEDEIYWMKKRLEYRGYEVQWDS
ncbi:MAG: nucleotidyltransferase domain-containing protein [Prevotellaceae bacterium]|jgi:predicted nucleotidyltransferase|nr:nucleotidyltransferase domain-containing protein [Prevotellaceae bacterium]